MRAEYIAPTPAEIEEIKHGNRETINRLYSANYPFILTICKAYCRNAEIKNTLWEDMAQECYLYFEKFELQPHPHLYGASVIPAYMFVGAVNGYLTKCARATD